VRVLLAVVVAACAGSARPAVTPKLSELPGDPQRRDAILDSANAEPTPEQHPPMTKKQRKAETVAATAAAVIGTILSDSSNVTIGVGSPIEMGHVDDPTPRKRASNADPAEEHERRHARDAGRRDPEHVDVPWVRLK
jgi:hypothetical protein